MEVLLLLVQVLVSNLCVLFSPTQNVFMKATYSQTNLWDKKWLRNFLTHPMGCSNHTTFYSNELHSVSSIRSFLTDHWKITSYRTKIILFSWNQFLFWSSAITSDLCNLKKLWKYTIRATWIYSQFSANEKVIGIYIILDHIKTWVQ